MLGQIRRSLWGSRIERADQDGEVLVDVVTDRMDSRLSDPAVAAVCGTPEVAMVVLSIAEDRVWIGRVVGMVRFRPEISRLSTE